jgi:hypothetical protein
LKTCFYLFGDPGWGAITPGSVVSALGPRLSGHGAGPARVAGHAAPGGRPSERARPPGVGIPGTASWVRPTCFPLVLRFLGVVLPSGDQGLLARRPSHRPGLAPGDGGRWRGAVLLVERGGLALDGLVVLGRGGGLWVATGDGPGGRWWGAGEGRWTPGAALVARQALAPPQEGPFGRSCLRLLPLAVLREPDIAQVIRHTRY